MTDLTTILSPVNAPDDMLAIIGAAGAGEWKPITDRQRAFVEVAHRAGLVEYRNGTVDLTTKGTEWVTAVSGFDRHPYAQCCERAVRLNCVCLIARGCVDHGPMHWGSHE